MMRSRDHLGGVLVWATRDERHPMALAVCWGLAWSLGASVSQVLASR